VDSNAEERQRAEELTHLKELHNILLHRKWLYELQKARTHPNTAPDVSIGLATTEQEIRVVESKMRRPRIGADVLESVGVDGLFLDVSERLDGLAATIKGFGQRVATIEITTAEGALWREQETRTRVLSQRKRLLIDMAILALLLTLLVLQVVR
jgi:ATP-dependent exoDNAse (exonuclease V) alpha subunit